MSSALTLILAFTAVGTGQQPGAIKKDEIAYQNDAFKHWWETPLVWKFDDLPTKGKVEDFRIPYSGHDYPDRGGGTIDVLRKYDEAFHDGKKVASEFERKDTKNAEERGIGGRERGLGWRIRVARARRRIPEWHGHCNGWTAAAIRHAEPEKNVVRNGVTFTPADIKGLLAEIYMYTDHEFLGGVDSAINPGTLHVVLCNWLGKGEHPIGIETALGETVFNYPAYSFTSSSTKHSDNEVEVQMTVTYATSTPAEYDSSPRNSRQMFFHYSLTLDDDGNVVGGTYYRDSSRLDMLWAPLAPIPGGKEGNERGNPHVDIKEVLAIWRESVPKELRNKWYNINPTPEDAILGEEDSAAVETDPEAPPSPRNQVQ